MRILVIGQGGREHCLVWKLSQSELVDTIFCAPGNGGTAAIAHNIGIADTDIDALLTFALKEEIDLTVVGPEAPLVEGIVDAFEAEGLDIFGPEKALAQLEASKVFAKELMKKYKIPTAAFEVFDDPQKAKYYLKRKKMPLVVKADGLAAGKGVVVCRTLEQALEAVDDMMVKKIFGTAGERIVIEQCLHGEEVSVLALTDGQTIIPLVTSQDHKRVFDGDEGPNTGGMGAYAPVPFVDEILFDKIMNKVFKPLLEGLHKEGKVYRGVLYAGLMIKKNEPWVLEFNVRFGDPETQVILPKLKSDLVEIMFKTIEGKLDEVKLQWDKRFCVGVVLVSGGYPGGYAKGQEIKGLEQLENMKDVFVFHAGTICKPLKDNLNPQWITSGGRVLSVVALGKNVKDAQGKVYNAVEKINFENMHYRKDIGNKAFNET